MTGNKGEWSEIYVFLKLLSEGKLYAADENLNRMADIFYPVISILRQEINTNREYKLNGDITIINGENHSVLNKVPIIEFLNNSKKLFGYLRSSAGRSFAFPDIEQFLNSIDVHFVTSTRTDKSDIKLIVHDLRTGLKPTLGFSIKSMIGQNSTLFNPGKTTNFIYQIRGKELKKLNIKKINELSSPPQIKIRIKTLRGTGFSLVFHDIDSSTFKLNLQLIDSRLPDILAYLLLYKYSGECGSNLKELLEYITEKNPLNFDLSFHHPFYEYKIKNFLTDAALGMTPSQIWKGLYDATGGIIIVKEDGDIVCYHIYNHNDFQNYLLNNTKLEQADMGRYKFGILYTEGEKILIKLNLQIRFI